MPLHIPHIIPHHFPYSTPSLSTTTTTNMKITLSSSIALLLSLAVSYSHQQSDYSLPDTPDKSMDMDYYPSELPGAMTVFPLDHGMSIVVNYTQYSDFLRLSVWFNNPNNYQYWSTTDHSKTTGCIFFAAGTPEVVDRKDNSECDFLPQYYKNGTTKPNGPTGENCIKNLNINPCQDDVTVSLSNCVDFNAKILHGKGDAKHSYCSLIQFSLMISPLL